MAVDDKLRVRAQRLHRGQADGVHADHQAGAAVRDEVVVAAQHLVDLAGDVGGVHDAPAGAVGHVVQIHASTARGALIERAVRAVALQLVILDEVDAGFGEHADLRRRGFGGHADARLDDGADERPAINAGEGARAGDAELRSLVRVEKCRRKREVQQLEAGEGACSSERLPATVASRLGSDGPMLCSGQESVTSAVRRMPSQFFGRAGAGQGGRGGGLAFRDGLDAGGEALAQFVGFAGHAQKRAGGLLAGHGRGGLLEREGGLDEVARVDAVGGVLGCILLRCVRAGPCRAWSARLC